MINPFRDKKIVGELHSSPIMRRYEGNPLLTAKDMIDQLSDRELGEELLFPEACLRAEGDLFLDDLSPTDLHAALGVPVRSVRNDPADLIAKLLGKDENA